MSDKSSRFPLSLSSVVDKKKTSGGGRDRDVAGRPQATTQTAAKNAAQSSQRAALKPVQQGLAQALRAPPVPPRAPVVPAQRLLSAAPAPRTAIKNVMTVTQTNDSHHASPLASEAVRKAMVARVAKQGVADAKVLAAMEAVPRHMFVEPGLASQAYIDASLPIGHHQTISQPYIVARMIEIMRQNRHGGRLDRVLEIGTGCGYQTAILAKLAAEVYSIERLTQLLAKARKNLRELRINNVRFKHADGHIGIPEGAPFDAILVTAAATHVPVALKEQLAPGGRMVVPMGTREQYLCVIERGARGFTEARLDAVKFVPMLSGLS